MFKKLFVITACILFVFCVTACRKSEKQLNDEIIIVNDTTDINLAISDYDTLNPIETNSNDVQSIMNIVYEPLFTVNEKFEIIPIIAKDYIMSDDGRKITVNLKEGIKWQDGTILTSEDIVYTLSKIKSSKGLYTGIADKIESFTATTKNQVIINLNKKYIDFAYFLTFPIISKDTEYTSKDSFKPMGTGAYKFVEKSGNKIELEANSTWHGDTIPKKKILVKVLKDRISISQAFNSNEIDAMVYNELLEDNVAPKGASVSKQILTPNMVFLGFNTANDKLNENIREAMSLLIDKQEIIDKCVYGSGKVCDFSVNPDSWIYKLVDEDKKSKNYITGLLKKAGLVLNDGVYERYGEEISYTILVNSENKTKMSIANLICEDLKAFGFDVSVEPVNYQEYLDRIRNDNFEMFIGEFETEEFVNPLEMLLGTDNYFNFDNTKLLSETEPLYSNDSRRYKKNISNIVEEFKKSSPYVPIYYKSNSMYYGEYVSGITQPVIYNLYNGIEKWYFYNKENKEDNNND